MEENNIIDELKSAVDKSYLATFLREYPQGARQVLGVPQKTLTEMARTYGHEKEWRILVDETLRGGTFEEELLRIAITDCANPQENEYFQRIAKFVKKLDSPQLCDASCLNIRLSCDVPDKMLTFLKDYLDSTKDIEQRFGLVMLLDYYVNTDYVDKTLELLLNTNVEGIWGREALAWAYMVCFWAYPMKTYAALEQMEVSNELFNEILSRIEKSSRLRPVELQVLQSLRMNRINESNQ